jgi:hypothetical protein
MARMPWLLALAPLLLAVAEVGAPRADPVGGKPDADGVNLEVVGACPEEAAVRRLADQLMAPGGARDVPVSIQDLGPRYRVAMLEGAMTFDDPGRDCAARARQAVAVMADELHVHPRVLGPPLWTIEKGLVFDVAQSANGPVWAPGAEIRGAYGPGLWSLVGAAGARGPVILTFQNDWKADLLRLPLDLGARLTMHRWRLRPWVVVGGSVTVTGIEGLNVVETDRVWRLDPGALLLAGATLPVRGRIGVAAALNVRWQPRPYQLDVAPVGRVGQTPAWWFGLSLNYTIDGKPSSP